VTSDFALTALQLRNELSAHALIPIMSLSVEIGCIGVIVYLIFDAAYRLARAEIFAIEPRPFSSH
jgi:hypothetical protein